MQIHQFNDLEGLHIAAEIERRGATFYSRMAKISKNPEVIALLSELAADEERHYREFQQLYTEQLAARDDDDYLEQYDEEASIYLSAIAAEVVFPGGLVDFATKKDIQNPVDILKTAIQSEKDSILFYAEMMNLAKDERTHDTFEQIVVQERTHLNKLQRKLMEFQDQ